MHTHTYSHAHTQIHTLSIPKLMILHHYHGPMSGGAFDVMFDIIGNGHGEPSSNPGRGSLYFTNTLTKGMTSTIHFSAIGEQWGKQGLAE